MTFQFKPAIRNETSLLIGIAGASGSGKTYSALRLATGLAGGGKIAFIDTEAGRALHYADQFTFDHGELTAPFTPDRYTEAIQAADKAGAKVIVIDSMSHEYEGEGGILEWADQLGQSMKAPKNWIKPKSAHKKMVGKLLQCRAHLIFCLRAEDKIKITKDDRGKMVILQPEDMAPQERWIPICEKRFMYEMTVSMVLGVENPGVAIPVKIQEQHRFAFPQGQHVSEKTGEALANWARGGKPTGTDAGQSQAPDPGPPADPDTGEISFKDEARAAARKGTEYFKEFWAECTSSERDEMMTIQDELIKLRKEADAREHP